MFSGALYGPESHSLTFFADALSLRPIYYRPPELVVSRWRSAFWRRTVSAAVRSIHGAYEMAFMSKPAQEHSRNTSESPACNSAKTEQIRRGDRRGALQGIQDEINALERRPDDRFLHLFLKFDDQIRHLAEHFENVYLDRFEFQLRFCDRCVLEIVLSCPV